MTKTRLARIKQFIKDCETISEDNDPISTMVAMLKELVKEVERLQRN